MAIFRTRGIRAIVFGLCFAIAVAAGFWVFFARERRGYIFRTSCVAKLNFLNLAKTSVEDELGLQEGDAVPVKELEKHLPRPLADFLCPSGGAYSVEPIGVAPKCSFTNVAYTYRFDRTNLSFIKRPWYHKHFMED